MGRQDFETETLISHALLAKGNDSFDATRQTYITHALSAEGFDASEDGTGRGVPMVPVAFNLRGREGGASPELSESANLRATSGGSSNSYIAFSAKDHGADANAIAPTLRGMGHSGSHANGGGQVAVAWSGELTASNDVTGTLQRGGEGGRADGVMTPQMAVRRLTPRECERLQGFPDDYTLIRYRGRLAADGQRYKALGNSMAVPVMRWIGERIAQVDTILLEHSDRREP